MKDCPKTRDTKFLGVLESLKRSLTDLRSIRSFDHGYSVKRPMGKKESAQRPYLLNALLGIIVFFPVCHDFPLLCPLFFLSSFALPIIPSHLYFRMHDSRSNNNASNIEYKLTPG